MRIIEYDPEHRDAVVELMAELQDCERLLSHDRPPGASMAAGHFDYLLGLCEARAGKVFLAVSETKVLGFVCVFLDTDDDGDLHLFPEYKQYGWISDLIVEENHRGSRAASLLLKRAERYCSSVGVRQLKLATLHNNDRARRFYEKSGYAEYEVIFRKGI